MGTVDLLKRSFIVLFTISNFFFFDKNRCKINVELIQYIFDRILTDL